MLSLCVYYDLYEKILLFKDKRGLNVRDNESREKVISFLKWELMKNANENKTWWFERQISTH